MQNCIQITKFIFVINVQMSFHYCEFEANRRPNNNSDPIPNTIAGGAGQAGLEPADPVHPYQRGGAQGGGQEAQTQLCSGLLLSGQLREELTLRLVVLFQSLLGTRQL